MVLPESAVIAATSAYASVSALRLTAGVVVILSKDEQRAKRALQVLRLLSWTPAGWIGSARKPPP